MPKPLSFREVDELKEIAATFDAFTLALNAANEARGVSATQDMIDAIRAHLNSATDAVNQLRMVTMSLEMTAYEQQKGSAA